MRRRPSLAQQLFLLQLAVILLLVSAGTVLAYQNVRRDSEAEASRRVLTLATTLAQLPEVHAALGAPDPTQSLQPLAESVRTATGVDFVVFMATDRTRYSHPNPAQIGAKFIGTIAPALAGQSHTETYTGTLGPSVRAVVPITSDGQRVVALVSVGILLGKIGQELQRRVPSLLAVSAAALAVAALGSFVISRRLRRQTLGLGPQEITRMYEHHDAVLHSVREGLLVLGRDGTLTLANDEAVRLLQLPAEFTGKPVATLGIGGSLAELITSGRPAQDELHVHGNRIIVANQQPAEKDGRSLGFVTTLRDHTELEALTGELNSVRGFAEALRAQAHESANRLHTVVTMIELGRPDQAVAFATSELATSQQLVDGLLGSVSEPTLAALLLGKTAQANERGIELIVTEDTEVHRAGIEARDLVTLVGNLLDNAIEAALVGPPPRWVRVTARCDDDELTIRVADSGPGVDTARIGDIFTRGWSTKPAEQTHGRGLGLALVQQVINRYGGSVQVSGEDGGAIFTVRLPTPPSTLHDA